MALGKKTGGRKRGTPNKVTSETADKVAASGLTPLDYMLTVLRNEEAAPADRQWAAEKAAPYVHPRLAAIDHSGTVALLSHEDMLNELDGEGEGSSAPAA